MITPHIGKLLEDNGYGTLVLTGSETGNPLIYSEKLPIGKNGIYLMSRGTPRGRNLRLSQSFDIYARGRNDLEGGDWLESILQFFDKQCYPACELPAITGYSERIYKNSIIVSTSSVENVGVDDTDRVIYVVSAQITYNKELINE